MSSECMALAIRLIIGPSQSITHLLCSYTGNARLSIQGGHYSKITFIVRSLHIKLHFLHLYTLKIDLKLQVCVLKILSLAMPMRMSTFHQDFPQLIFQQGGP